MGLKIDIDTYSTNIFTATSAPVSAPPIKPAGPRSSRNLFSNKENSARSRNSAISSVALQKNTTGNYHTATGVVALHVIRGDPCGVQDAVMALIKASPRLR